MSWNWLFTCIASELKSKATALAVLTCPARKLIEMNAMRLTNFVIVSWLRSLVNLKFGQFTKFVLFAKIWCCWHLLRGDFFGFRLSAEVSFRPIECSSFVC